MDANEAVTHTDSEKTSSYKFVKKRAVQLTIKFKIEEFEALMESTEPGVEGELLGEGVSSELAPRAFWMLGVYPNGLDEEDRGNIFVFLWVNIDTPMAEGGEEESINATCHIYLVDGSGDSKIDSIKRGTENFKNYVSIFVGIVSHDRVRKALHEDGSLLVAADVEFLLPDERGAEAVSESTLRGYKDREQWAAKFSEFHGDATTSDCSIKIGDVKIPAHKLPLMACSPAFRAMFTNPSAESKSGVIEISDFPPEPVRALIRYCYQGQLDDATKDGDGALEIFKLADKYLIDDLKAQLEEHFINKRLSVGNVIEMAKLADAHSAEKLKKACVELIAREWDTVSESTEWKRMEEEMPELAAELAEAATAEE